MTSPEPENSPPPVSTGSMQERLATLVQVLRSTDHLEPEAQTALANLVEELGVLLNPTATASQTSHLAETTLHLAQALYQQHESTLIDTAVKRLEEAVVRAEAHAPVATGAARKLIDILANSGI